MQGKLELLFVPAGIMAARVFFVSALCGDYQAVQFRGCDIGRAGWFAGSHASGCADSRGALVSWLGIRLSRARVLNQMGDCYYVDCFCGNALRSCHWDYSLDILGKRVFLCLRSEEHTSELQSLMRISYAVFCLNKKKHIKVLHQQTN